MTSSGDWLETWIQALLDVDDGADEVGGDSLSLLPVRRMSSHSWRHSRSVHE
jgi:hypothetical protein